MNPDNPIFVPAQDPLNPIQGIAGAFKAADLVWQLPMLILVVSGLLVVLLDAFSKEGSSRRWLMGVSGFAVGLALVLAVVVWRELAAPHVLYDGMLVADRFSMLVTVGILSVALLTILLSGDWMREHAVEYGEYYALVIFAVTGMIMLVMAADLVAIFLGIETMSLGVYVLTGAVRRNRRSTEAAMKYFLTGAFASGFLLYGIALVYGVTGTTRLGEIAVAAQTADTNILFLIGVFMLIVAFGFKVAAVPFHMWAPDAYEGAPSPITGFMSAAVKAAGIAALLRVFTSAFGGDVLPDGRMGWASLLSIAAAATMTLGNVVALRQENVKRLLAYSSIAHVGYMLMGLVAGGAPGAGAILFYLLAYTFTTVGAFGMIGLCARAGEEAVEVGDYAGLARRHPVLAATLALFLLSLVGIPPLAGFVSKFYLFGSAVRAGYVWLTVIAVLNSAVAAYYYLRVIIYMYMREPDGEPVAVSPSLAGGLALALALVGIVVLGLMPAPFADLAQAAVAPLLR
jgi:NADH-quinone oxidoreductase subunit N